jgi:Zn-dependent protease with chaperone function
MLEDEQCPTESDMIPKTARPWIATLGLATLIAASADGVYAQTLIKPGFNLFSLEQDQEIGQQSAAEAERQLPIFHDRSIEAYIGKIGARLAAVAPGADFPYQFKLVNASDINAFALPGGYLYLNRGLIEAALNEGQLAGVMAHEMAHVALRHGTSQASKAYLGQAGLGLLGGLIGKDDHSTDETIAAVGGFGMNTLFLKFSRAAEEQADITGAQMMAAAGYDPADMVDFFDYLAEQQTRDPSKVEQFFSSHPASADRADRINDEMRSLTVRPIRPVGGLAKVQSELSRMRPAASLAQTSGRTTSEPPARRSESRDRPVADIRLDGPSRNFRVFEQRDGLFQIEYPDNWRVYEADHGYGVTIAPQGGFVATGGPESDLVAGVIVNHYDSLEDDASDRFSSGRGRIDGDSSLVRATNDLIDHILRINTNMRMIDDSERRDRIDGAPSLSVVLSGRSPATGQEERVTVFTREIPDEHVIYALFIAPQQDYDRLNETFNRMISSLEVRDDETHSSNSRRNVRQDERSVASVSSTATVPSGTVLKVSFLQTLSSASSQPDERFTAEIVEPVLVNGRVAIAAGSTISGRVVDVQPAKRFGGRAQLNLEFTSLRLSSGKESPISASFHGQAEEKSKDAVVIGGAAAGGAILGRILGDDEDDAVRGAILGGAIGTGIAAKNRGEEVTLPEGIAVEIQLDTPFSY